MPKKLPPKEKDAWIEAYEEGLTYTQIASKYKRDYRTVKKAIEEARRSHDAISARVELLKDAIKQHQVGLRKTADSILQALVIPSLQLTLPWRNPPDPSILDIPGLNVVCQSVDPPAVEATYDKEGTLLWELLQEHIRRDQIWGAAVKWKDSLVSNLGARIALKSRAAAVLEEKTGYRLQENPEQPPYLLVKPLLNVLYESALNQGLGISYAPVLENNIGVDTDSGMVIYGNGRLVMAASPGAEEQCKEDIIGACRALAVSEEAKAAVETYGELERLTTRAKRMAEEIMLLGLIPGDCSVCRRLGM